MTGKTLQQHYPMSILSPLSHTRKRYIIEKKHKLHYEPNSSELSRPHTPLRKLWVAAYPQVWWTQLPLHHATSLFPFTWQVWKASSTSQTPEQLKSSPSLPPRKEAAGHGISELFWWHKGLSFVFRIDTVLFVVTVCFAAEIKWGQGIQREQPSNLEQIGFVCISQELERSDLTGLLLFSVPRPILLHVPFPLLLFHSV